MIFQFQDKAKTIKHLGFLIETKILNTQTLRVKESIMKNSISEDLLFYDSPSALNKDIKKLFRSLEEYTRHVDDMNKQQPIGFAGGGVGGSDEMPCDEQPEEDEE